MAGLSATIERVLHLSRDATEQQELQAALCAALLAAIPASRGGSSTSNSSGGPCPDNTAASSCAAAWTAAAPALAAIYAWDDQAVVHGVITFWHSVATILLANEGSGGTARDQGQQAFVAWLWAVTPAGVAAVVDSMHAFWRLTGVAHLAHMQQPATAAHQHLLLLFLELTAGSSSTLQLLQLCCSASRRRPETAAAAMTASEAFAGTCSLLQASVGQPAQQMQQLVARAGALLRNGYGWSDFSSAACVSAAAAAGASAQQQAALGGALADTSTLARPQSLHSLYDCFIQQLAFELLRGPQPCVDDGPELMPADAAEPACNDEDAWEAWLLMDGFKCLASLVVSYDRPHALVRGLHVLAQEQLLQQRQAAAAAASAATEATQPTQPSPAASSQRAGHKAGSSKEEAVAAKAAMHRVMRLLECVFLAAEEPGVACFHPAAFGVRQLLLGLSELLRPSANCSVEWRLAALGLIRAALEQHAERSRAVGGERGAGRPAEGSEQLWSEASAEGLLFCLGHDSSIGARRAAASLLQRVVVPASSPTARALVRCLAWKLADRDQTAGGVASIVLRLFVQLDAPLVCGALTPTEWCAAVQAGLELVSGSSQDGSRAAFVRLLKAVLTEGPEAGPDTPPLQPNRVAGPHGCRRVLLMLMLEPLLEEKWRALLQGVGGGSSE